MTTELMRPGDRIKTIRELLVKNKDQIIMALPKHLSADRLIRIAMTTIRRNPKLLECDPRTLLGALIQCSQLGLEPDDILGHAYLVPFDNNKLHKTDVQLMVGYKGFIDLAERTGKVHNIYARIVYEKELLTLEEGTEPKLVHKPLPPAERGQKKVGVYAVAFFTNGGRPKFEWLWPEDVEKARGLSKSKGSQYSPWNTHEDDMWKKTAIRRLAKYLPLSPEFQKAASLDELGETELPQKEIFFGDDEPLEEAGSPYGDPKVPEISEPKSTITQEQITAIQKGFTELKLSEEGIGARLASFNVVREEDLTKEQADMLLVQLRKESKEMDKREESKCKKI